MPGIYTLNGVIKHYDWGGNSFIPRLLGLPEPSKKPCAEYWLGIHPLGIATADTGGSQPTPVNLLAPDLSFLLKILDIKEMLSIQVHPSLETAKAGFEAENAAGIPPDAAHRNYKDPNHKPELSVALGEFWLLHGFKQEQHIADTLHQVPELQELLPRFREAGLRGLYQYLMEMPQQEVDRILQPLLNRLNTEEELNRSTADYWVRKAAGVYNKGEGIDRGIFSIYLLNLVCLQKGEGIFQDAGVPHAYLEGQIVEIMANSDNVLRGGLTTKHTDIPELLKNTVTEGILPAVLLPQALQEGEGVYVTPYPDFKLSKIELAAGDTFAFTPETVEIILLTEGRAEIDDDQIALKLEPGRPAVLVFPGEPVYLAAAMPSTLYRAGGTVHRR